MAEIRESLSEEERLMLLQPFTEALRYLPDAEKTWDEILGVMMSLTSGQNCSLMLKSGNTNELVIRAAKGKSDAEAGEGLKLFRKSFDRTDGVASWVLNSGRGIYLADVEKDTRFIEIEESPFGIGSLMCFPIRDGDETVGVVNLSHGDKAAFGELEEQAMKIVSNQLAMVLTAAGVTGGHVIQETESAPMQGRTVPRNGYGRGRRDRQVEMPWPGGCRNGENSQFIYKSGKMVRIMDMIGQVADTDVTVLIHGESGVGKEPVARALHYQSTRKDKPFIKVNCAALPEELLESELFGYEKGAFTGAYNRKPGKFELAHGGTIFLDEIAEISPSLQAKLLQVLQDGEFARLGGKQDIQVNVRVLVATNKNLEDYVRKGRFREDLYYRLNVLNIHVPPLRERRDEIAALSLYFLEHYGRKYGKPLPVLSPETNTLLLGHDWPGNVRELENMMKRLVVLGDEEVIRNALTGRPQVPAPEETIAVSQPTVGPKTLSLKEISRRAAIQAEREVIQKTLEQTHWNRKMAAKLLAISYKALLYKIKECGLDNPPAASAGL